MSADVDIKIAAKNQAKAELDQLRKDFRDLQKAQREATDPAQARAFEKAIAAVDARIKDAQASLRKANIELDKAESKSKGLGRVWQGMGRFITENAEKIRLAGVAAAAAVGLFAKTALSKFSSVEDAGSALEATFGRTGEAMIAWAKRSGDALNLSQEEALNALQRFAGVGMAAQMHGQQLAGFAQNLVERAAQMASYYGGTTQDALDAISAGLRGEADPLERYNVFLSDMALKAELVTVTGQKVNGTLSAQQRILAANALIMRQTGVASGDIARTQDSTANTIKDATQQWADFQASMGDTVAVIAGPVLRVLSMLLAVLSDMPGPVKFIVVAVTLLGIAAMIATPRILAIRASLLQIKAAGGKGIFASIASGIRGMGVAGVGAAAAVAGLAIGLASYLNAQANAQAAAEEYRDTLNEINGAATEASYQNIAGKIASDLSEEDLGRLQRVGITLTDMAAAAVEGGPALAAMQQKIADVMASWRTGLVNQDDLKALDGARRSIENQTESVHNGAAEWRAAQAAQEAAATAADRTAAAHGRAAGAAERQGAAEKALAGALTQADRILARRDAMRGYRDAMTAFSKKPSAETGDAVTKAALAVGRTYADPAKRSKWVIRSYKDIDETVNKSNLDKTLKDKIVAPYELAYLAAKKYLRIQKEINQAVPLQGKVGKLTAELGLASGGPVWGPGTATSDSIPARLSRGEFVIRAAAAKAIGYEKLTVLNHADRIPTALTPISHASSAPIVVQPHLTAQVTAHGQIDYEQALRRESRKVMRDARTRYAKAGRG